MATTLTTKPTALYGNQRKDIPLGAGGQVNTGDLGVAPPANILQAGGATQPPPPVKETAVNLSGIEKPLAVPLGAGGANTGKRGETPTGFGPLAGTGTPPGATAVAGTDPEDIAIEEWRPEDVQMLTHDVQENELVQGQLARILASDNPIMANARGKAMQFANERGLLNSSLAAQAGEQAVIESALPIAQQDAATYGRQALANQDYSNQGVLASYNMKNQAAANRTQFGQTRQLGVDQERAAMRAAIQSQGFQREMFDKDATLKERLTNLDNASRERLGAMQIQAAEASAAASRAVAEAQIAAQERMQQVSVAAQQNAQAADIASREGMFDADLAWRRESNTSQLNSRAMDTYTQQFTAIMTAPDISQEDRQRMLQNLNAMWNGSGYLPPGMFNASAFGGAPS